MAEIDLFADRLLEEAKRFLEKSNDCSDAPAKAANLHAALMLSFCSLEAHINSIAEEFSAAPGLSAHERGLLLEKDVGLEAGEFKLRPSLRMTRLEDRIEFLYTKFSGEHLDHSSGWWGQLSSATRLRNELTHAKAVPAITDSAVADAMHAIIDTLSVLYLAIYKRKFPSSGQRLHSRLTF